MLRKVVYVGNTVITAPAIRHCLSIVWFRHIDIVGNNPRCSTNLYWAMTSKALKGPFLRAVAKRSFAAEACPATAASPSAREVKQSILPNKLKVASLDDNSPISRVSVIFRAGSRFETGENLGTNHVLRVAAGLATNEYSYFGITRRIQQVGASLNVTGDREFIAYTLEANSDLIGDHLDILANVASQQSFKPWEVSDNIPARLKYDLAALCSGTKAIDLLHKAAFRRGLGNSLFCPDYLVGKISPETLKHYVEKHFTVKNAAVVGVNLDHDCLVQFAQSLTLADRDVEICPGVYKGGEIRQASLAPFTTVAVGFEGVSAKNLKDVLTCGVLQYALGVGPFVKWGSYEHTPLGKATSSTPAAVSALSVSYADSGLFGFIAASPPDCIGQVVKAAAKELCQGKLDETSICRGKNQMKASILMAAESSSEALSDIGGQLLLTGKVLSPDAIVKVLDSIDDAAVAAARDKICSGPMSMAAVGDLEDVPYIDELK